MYEPVFISPEVKLIQNHRVNDDATLTPVAELIIRCDATSFVGHVMNEETFETFVTEANKILAEIKKENNAKNTGH